jgi:hypothetical protein
MSPGLQTLAFTLAALAALSAVLVALHVLTAAMSRDTERPLQGGDFEGDD